MYKIVKEQHLLANQTEAETIASKQSFSIIKRKFQVKLFFSDIGDKHVWKMKYFESQYRMRMFSGCFDIRLS